LSPGFSHHSAAISKEELQRFRDAYGDSAFTCRYPHCGRAADGFRVLQEREKHEAQHRRQYRCDTPMCTYSEMGFATRAQLNQHTRKYHPQVYDETSLANEVRALKKRRLAEQRVREEAMKRKFVEPTAKLKPPPPDALEVESSLHDSADNESDLSNVPDMDDVDSSMIFPNLVGMDGESPSSSVNGGEGDGDKHLPWLQLNASELEHLRKRMKRNASWSPSDTMIARELKMLGRGIEAYRAAKAKAEAAGELFDQPQPPQLRGETVHAKGAISVDALRLGPASSHPAAGRFDNQMTPQETAMAQQQQHIGGVQSWQLDEAKDSRDTEVEVGLDPTVEGEEKEPVNPNRCMFVSLEC
jgi:hypothetical protein